MPQPYLCDHEVLRAGAELPTCANRCELARRATKVQFDFGQTFFSCHPQLISCFKQKGGTTGQ